MENKKQLRGQQAYIARARGLCQRMIGDAAVTLKRKASILHFHIKANFQCPRRCSGGGEWSSNWAWLTIDLRKMKIARASSQKCQHCLSRCRSYIPAGNSALWDTFDAAFERALSKGLEREMGIDQKLPSLSEQREEDLQHKQPLCQKCVDTGVNCTSSGGVVAPEAPSTIPCGFKSWIELFKHARPGGKECEERAAAYFEVYRALKGGLQASDVELDMRPHVSGGKGVFLGGSTARGTYVSRSAKEGPDADQDVVVYIKGFDPTPDSYGHYLELFKAALQQVLSPEDPGKLHVEVKNKSIHFKHKNFRFDVLAGGAVTAQQLLDVAAARGQHADRIRKNLKPSVSMHQVKFIKKDTKALLGHQKGDFWLPDIVRVAKLWAEQNNILKRRGCLAPYLVELLVVRAMEDIHDTWSSPTARLWSIDDCSLIWRRFLELLTENKVLNVHWNPSPSHERVMRMREEHRAEGSNSARQFRRVRMAEERPFVLDPANPTNNVAYRVCSNDPYRRAWITISRAARSALEDMSDAREGQGGPEASTRDRDFMRAFEGLQVSSGPR